MSFVCHEAMPVISRMRDTWIESRVWPHWRLSGSRRDFEAFRLLVAAGSAGVPAGQIAVRLGCVQNTTSAHLKIFPKPDWSIPNEMGEWSGTWPTWPASESCSPTSWRTAATAHRALSSCHRCGHLQMLNEECAMNDQPLNVLFPCTGNSARSRRITRSKSPFFSFSARTHELVTSTSTSAPGRRDRALGISSVVAGGVTRVGGVHVEDAAYRESSPTCRGWSCCHLLNKSKENR